jgi:transposase
MFDVNDDAKAGFRRVELLTGPGRPRRWSAGDKARVVADTLVDGTRVSEVARRWQICPQQVFGWRRQARMDVTAAAPSEQKSEASPVFVPIVVDAARPAAPAPTVIEIRIAGAVVHVGSGTDTALLSEVLRAVRASATRA